MPIRLYEIAEAHGDDAHSLRRKAEALGFRIKGFSISLDKITAEALELAVYGQAIAVRFDARPRSAPTFSPSVAGGRIVHLRHLMTLVRTLFCDAGSAQAVELKAKELAHLLAISKWKDGAKIQPPEWQDAEVLIAELASSGVSVQIEEIPSAHVLKEPQPFQKPVKAAPDVKRHKKKKKARKKKKVRPKPKLIFTAFETNRRRH